MRYIYIAKCFKILVSIIISSKEMATTAWQEHVQTHGKSMARALQEHCESMARPWQKHGESMARPWQEHGKRRARRFIPQLMWTLKKHEYIE